MHGVLKWKPFLNDDYAVFSYYDDNDGTDGGADDGKRPSSNSFIG